MFFSFYRPNISRNIMHLAFNAHCTHTSSQENSKTPIQMGRHRRTQESINQETIHGFGDLLTLLDLKHCPYIVGKGLPYILGSHSQLFAISRQKKVHLGNHPWLTLRDLPTFHFAPISIQITDAFHFLSSEKVLSVIYL